MKTWPTTAQNVPAQLLRRQYRTLRPQLLYRESKLPLTHALRQINHKPPLPRQWMADFSLILMYRHHHQKMRVLLVATLLSVHFVFPSFESPVSNLGSRFLSNSNSVTVKEVIFSPGDMSSLIFGHMYAHLNDVSNPTIFLIAAATGSSTN